MTYIWSRYVNPNLETEMVNAKNRSSRLEVFWRKGVLRYFAKFTGKRLYKGLFFNKVQTLVQVLSCEFCKISKNTFSYKTPPVAASVKLHVKEYQTGFSIYEVEFFIPVM